MAELGVSHISVVIPVYRAEDCLRELHRRLTDSLLLITPDYEIILVEDCGGDGSWDVVVELTKEDPKVKGVKLSRNYGQHYAITAGLDHATGDWIIVMDDDLQDQPEEIPKLYEKAQEGYSIVFGCREGRRDAFTRKLSSRVFSAIYNYLGDIKLDNSISNFSIASRRVIANVRKYGERNRSYPLLLNSVGFRKAYVPVEHKERYAGRSSYNLPKLIGFAVENIVSQSNKPLHISIYVGFIWAALFVCIGLYILIHSLLHGVSVSGWASLIVSLQILGGLICANLGILGVYLGKVFDESKGRPLYIVEESRNFADQFGESTTDQSGRCAFFEETKA